MPDDPIDKETIEFDYDNGQKAVWKYDSHSDCWSLATSDDGTFVTSEDYFLSATHSNNNTGSITNTNPIEAMNEAFTPIDNAIKCTVIASTVDGRLNEGTKYTMKGDKKSRWYVNTDKGNIPVYSNGGKMKTKNNGLTNSQIKKGYRNLKFNNKLNKVSKGLGFIEYGAIAVEYVDLGLDIYNNGWNEENSQGFVDLTLNTAQTVMENLVIDRMIMSGNPFLMFIGGVYYIAKFIAGAPKGISTPDPRYFRGLGQDTTLPERLGLPLRLQDY